MDECLPIRFPSHVGEHLNIMILARVYRKKQQDTRKKHMQEAKHILALLVYVLGLTREGYLQKNRWLKTQKEPVLYGI